MTIFLGTSLNLHQGENQGAARSIAFSWDLQPLQGAKPAKKNLPLGMVFLHAVSGFF